MPRYIINPPKRSPRSGELVDRLSRELDSSGSDALQPLILERHIPTTGSRHVHVIWDEWEGMPETERTAVIIEAYAKIEGEDRTDDITIALGLTPREAIDFGLLPYRVQPARPELAERTDYRAAMAEESRRTLLGHQTGGGVELRYVRNEDARRAVKSLRRILPRSSWEVIRISQSED